MDQIEGLPKMFSRWERMKHGKESLEHKSMVVLNAQLTQLNDNNNNFYNDRCQSIDFIGWVDSK